MLANPDDFALIYPKFKTFFNYSIPELGLNVSGDFSITYDMSRMKKDYYTSNSYAAYDYADKALIQFTTYIPSTKYMKLLIIHNSFANCVIPFMALVVRSIDEIDLRYFTGSIRSYIRSSNPDVVIIMYNSTVPGRSQIKNVSREDKRLFDLR